MLTYGQRVESWTISEAVGRPVGSGRIIEDNNVVNFLEKTVFEEVVVDEGEDAAADVATDVGDGDNNDDDVVSADEYRVKGGKAPSRIACQESPFFGRSSRVAACHAVNERAKTSALGKWS